MAERQFLIDNINKIYPPSSKLSKAKPCDVLLFGINLDSPLPVPRIRSITYAVQQYITKEIVFQKFMIEILIKGLLYFSYIFKYFYIRLH